MAVNNSATMNSNKPNQPIKAEQAKAEMSSSQRQTGEQGRVRDEIGSSHPADKQEALKNDRESVTPR
ncbi:MAG TPA: hypothetical protein VFQ06_11090 [Nitrospira sp.]|nr:hypothetical protein [Nitrospira sp.]